MKIGELLRISWTPLKDWPDTSLTQGMDETEAKQGTGGFLIPIRGLQPNAEICEEGMDCLKISGLLQNGRTPSKDWPDPFPVHGMGQRSVLEHCGS
jgi:hypothetical protein